MAPKHSKTQLQYKFTLKHEINKALISRGT